MSKTDSVDLACVSDVVCVLESDSTWIEHQERYDYRNYVCCLLCWLLLWCCILKYRPPFYSLLCRVTWAAAGTDKSCYEICQQKLHLRNVLFKSFFRRRTAFTWHLHGFVEMLQTNVLTLCKVKNYETCLSDVKATAHCLLFSCLWFIVLWNVFPEIQT
jgi:hypothetical protein